MASLRERRRDFVVRVWVVRESVEQNYGRSIGWSVLEIGDVQDGGLNLNGIYSDAGYSPAWGGRIEA